MEKFTNWEKHGLMDLFNSEAAADIVIPIAKIVSKNMLNPQTNSGISAVIYVLNILLNFNCFLHRSDKCNFITFNQFTKYSQSEGDHQRKSI